MPPRCPQIFTLIMPEYDISIISPLRFSLKFCPKRLKTGLALPTQGTAYKYVDYVKVICTK